MQRGNANRQVLRCKEGDLARIVDAWNRTLVGRVVLVESFHKENEWRITLLGEPGVTLTKNRRRLGIGNKMLADDAQLEPIRDPVPDVVTAIGATGPHRRSRRPLESF